jgi:hypothetical protein
MNKNMTDKTPIGRLVVYIRSPDGDEEELCEQDLDPEKTATEAIGDALVEMSLGQRTPVDSARFMLNMRDVKGNDRRRMRAIVEKDDCRKCIIENKGTCVRGHTVEWIKKILA